ncbi:lysozyme 2-like [Tachypleus tridentatus]|uniref:lysozyme 2-like n=1 Tax=Tachypleus tridentatus TaxID=6853 RepID=UPI003FD48274
MWKVLIYEVLLVTVTVIGQNYVSDECLKCICQASTKCNLSQGCNTNCGPYLISFAYWKDAGLPGKTKNYVDYNDFVACVTNVQCAKQTIRGYMKNWARNCVKNREINCNDVARIHKTGRVGCHGTWYKGTDYWKLFKQCYPY